jgi:hypothetical protein
MQSNPSTQEPNNNNFLIPKKLRDKKSLHFFGQYNDHYDRLFKHRTYKPMKNTYKLIIALATAATLTTASAATKITTNIVTISGANAFAPTASAALDALYNSNNAAGVVSPLGSSWSLIARSGDGSGGNQGKDTFRLYGYTNSSSANFITVSWLGSEAAIRSLANKTVNSTFLPINQPSSSSTGFAAATYQAPVQIGVVDLQQGNSHFYGKGISSLGDSLTYGILSAPTPVAVQGYAWYKGGSNWPANTTNITKEIEQELFINGQVPLARFTGNTNDLGTPVYLVGRNTDSGSRSAALLAAGLPAITPVVQYAVDTNGNVALYQSELVDGLTLNTGQSGYATTSQLINALKYAGNGSNLVVGYASAGNSVSPSGSNPGVSALTHEGSTPSAINIETGNYPFWATLYLYQPKTPLTGLASATFQSFATWLKTDSNYPNSANGSAIHLGSMSVRRAVDFGTTSPK